MTQNEQYLSQFNILNLSFLRTLRAHQKYTGCKFPNFLRLNIGDNILALLELLLRSRVSASITRNPRDFKSSGISFAKKNYKSNLVANYTYHVNS